MPIGKGGIPAIGDVNGFHEMQILGAVLYPVHSCFNRICHVYKAHRDFLAKSYGEGKMQVRDMH